MNAGTISQWMLRIWIMMTCGAPVGAAYIKLTSEQGRDCHIVNPWTSEGVKTLGILRNGKESKMDVSDRFTLPTSKGEVIIVTPWDMAPRTFD